MSQETVRELLAELAGRVGVQCAELRGADALLDGRVARLEGDCLRVAARLEALERAAARQETTTRRIAAWVPLGVALLALIGAMLPYLIGGAP